MDNKKLREIVEDGVNDLILIYQKDVGINDGGVEPLKQLELDDIEEKLVNWIKEVFPWE